MVPHATRIWGLSSPRNPPLSPQSRSVPAGAGGCRDARARLPCPEPGARLCHGGSARSPHRGVARGAPQRQQQRGPAGLAECPRRAPPGSFREPRGQAQLPGPRGAGDRGVGAHLRPRPAQHRGGGCRGTGGGTALRHGLGGSGGCDGATVGARQGYLGKIIDAEEPVLRPEQVSALFGNIEDIYELSRCGTGASGR